MFRVGGGGLSPSSVRALESFVVVLIFLYSKWSTIFFVLACSFGKNKKGRCRKKPKRRKGGNKKRKGKKVRKGRKTRKGKNGKKSTKSLSQPQKRHSEYMTS